MADATKKKVHKKWNETHHYWEIKQADGSYREQTREGTKTLSEEKFSSVLIKLREPNYNTTPLIDTAELQAQIELGTKGATEKREEEDFGAMESPVVYYGKRKVEKKERNVHILRTINTSRPNDLYETFIHKALWSFSRSDVDSMLEHYRAKMEQGGVWERYGWSTEPPPPLVRGKKQFNCDAYVKMLQREQEKARQNSKKAV